MMTSKAERPGKIVCVGRNYSEHAKELGNEVPKEPLIFLKPPSSVIGEGDAIVLPKQSKQIEHEAEIGIIAVNDVTARDLQKTDGQWTRAKGFDTFCPLGTPAKKYPALDTLTVICRVNGKETQRGESADMVFNIPMLLSYISGIMTLEPGDLVATGTPSGVSPLKDGDVVEVEIVGVSKV